MNNPSSPEPAKPRAEVRLQRDGGGMVVEQEPAKPRAEVRLQEAGLWPRRWVLLAIVIAIHALLAIGVLLARVYSP